MQAAKNRKGEKALSRACGTAGPLQGQTVLVCFHLLCFSFSYKTTGSKFKS